RGWGEAVEMGPQLLRCFEHEGKIGMAVATTQRRADGKEYEISVAHRKGELGREADPAIAQIALEQLLEARFVDRHQPATQLLDLVSVLIGAGAVPAELGHK